MQKQLSNMILSNEQANTLIFNDVLSIGAQIDNLLHKAFDKGLSAGGQRRAVDAGRNRPACHRRNPSDGGRSRSISLATAGRPRNRVCPQIPCTTVQFSHFEAIFKNRSKSQKKISNGWGLGSVRRGQTFADLAGLGQ